MQVTQMGRAMQSINGLTIPIVDRLQSANQEHQSNLRITPSFPFIAMIPSVTTRDGISSVDSTSSVACPSSA